MNQADGEVACLRQQTTCRLLLPRWQLRQLAPWSRPRYECVPGCMDGATRTDCTSEYGACHPRKERLASQQLTLIRLLARSVAGPPARHDANLHHGMD